MYEGLSKIIPWVIGKFPEAISTFVPGGVFKLKHINPSKPVPYVTFEQDPTVRSLP